MNADNCGRRLSAGQAGYFSGTKVVNTKGELVRCYHSTKASFDTFEYGHTANGNLFGDGFYFSCTSDSIYAYGGIFVEAYLLVRKPYVYGHCEELLRECGIDYAEEAKKHPFTPFTDDISVIESLGLRFRDLLLKAGYDAVFVDCDPDFSSSEAEIVVFRPEQIKRVGNLNPTGKANMNESVSSGLLREFMDWLDRNVGTTDVPVMDEGASYILPPTEDSSAYPRGSCGHTTTCPWRYRKED